LAFHKGTPDIHIHELSLTENRWQSCCTKYSHLEVIHKWVVSSERVIYPLKFRFYDKGSRISFLCTVTLLTRLCISFISHVRPWRQALTHVEQRDGDGPINHVYQKSKAILTSCHWFKIQSSIHNWVIVIYVLPFKARSTLGASTLIGIFKNIKFST
jgi:hypothetical protein